MGLINWKVNQTKESRVIYLTMNPESAYRYEIKSNTHGHQTAQMKGSPIVWDTLVMVLTNVTELLYTNIN